MPIVLVVDCDARFRQTVALYLRQAGFSVLEADGPQAAYDRAVEGKPCCVFVEHNLPYSDTVGLAETLRSNPALELSVYGFTADEPGAEVKGTDRHGSVTNWFKKPADPMVYASKVRSLIT